MTTEFDDEALVAYLDGELSAEQRQQLDQQLESHPALRERLHQLRKTWDLLEELPSDLPSPRFAETTLEMAALSSTDEPKANLSRLFINYGRMFIFILPLLFLGGIVSSKYLQSRTERQLLRDLPILVDWRSLSNIDSVAWLEVLADQPDLASVSVDAEFGLVGDGNVPIELKKRRDWVENLSDTDRGRLSINLTEYQQREPTRQSQLRNIIAEVYSDPKKKEKYLAAARSYELLLQEQSMTQRAGLYDLPLEERRSELGNLVSVHMSEQYAKKIPAEDAEAIRNWSEDMTKKYFIGRNADALQSVYFELFVNYAASEISMMDFEDLAARLSDEAQNILGGLNSSEAYMETLVDWIAALAVPNDTSVDRVSPDKMKELYLNLSGSQQDQIDLLKPEQAKAAIRRLSKPRTSQ